MGVRETFFESSYEDSLHLSDQLLLPNLVRGSNLVLLSGFLPSYLVKLVADLAASPEIEPGTVNFCLYVNQAYSSPENALAWIKRQIDDTLGSNSLAVRFVESLVAVMEEARSGGATSVSVRAVFHKASRPALQGALGIISASGDNNDFVGFADKKKGDGNSPIKPYKSWEASSVLEADDVLGSVLKVMGGQLTNSKVVNHDTLLAWFQKLHEWYRTNEEETAYQKEDEPWQPSSDPIAELRRLEEVEFGSGLVEAEDDEFDQVGDIYEEELDFDYILEELGVRVSESETLLGHVPPLDEFTASLLGPVTATCTCGKNFVRAEGCPKVIWDRWTTDYRDEWQ